MASDKRPIIKLRSTAGTGFTYVTTKNKTNTRERIEIKKYDPVVRKHVIFKEERLAFAASASTDADLGLRRCRRPRTAPLRCSTPASGVSPSHAR